MICWEIMLTIHDGSEVNMDEKDVRHHSKCSRERDAFSGKTQKKNLTESAVIYLKFTIWSRRHISF